jgi:hypothetical protein
MLLNMFVYSTVLSSHSRGKIAWPSRFVVLYVLVLLGWLSELCVSDERINTKRF